VDNILVELECPMVRDPKATPIVAPPPAVASAVPAV
jgi:hypothetical protein